MIDSYKTKRIHLFIRQPILTTYHAILLRAMQSRVRLSNDVLNLCVSKAGGWQSLEKREGEKVLSSKLREVWIWAKLMWISNTINNIWIPKYFRNILLLLKISTIGQTGKVDQSLWNWTVIGALIWGRKSFFIIKIICKAVKNFWNLRES